MSVIGPRPALWNQDVLIAEREKYHANDVKPGLTGWAQINGRDELEIPVKAKLDGEYVEKESLLFDIKCFLGTIGKVAKDDSVVEGGTGEMSKSNCRSGSRDSCIAACDHKHRLSDPIGLYYQLWFDCRPWMCDRRRRTYFSGDCDQGRKSDSKSNKN